MDGADIPALLGAVPAAIPVAGFVILVIIALRAAGAGRKEARDTDERLDKAQRDLDEERERRRKVEDQMSALTSEVRHLRDELARRSVP